MRRTKNVRSRVVIAATAVAAATTIALISPDVPRLTSLPTAGPSTVASAAVVAASAALPSMDLPRLPNAVALKPLSELPPSAAAKRASAAAASGTPERHASTVRIDNDERRRLASEMGRWKTRHPRQLVEVIADLAEKQ